MRRWFLRSAAMLGVLALALAALWLAPSFIDMGRYRAEAEGALEAALERKVAFHGPIRLTLLPAPALVLGGLEIVNIPGGTRPELATVGELSVRLRLWPLIKGELVAEELALDRVAAALEILPDGRINWDFGTPKVKLERIRVTRAAATFVDRRGGAAGRADAIDATVALGGPRGPLALDGRMTLVDGGGAKRPVELALQIESFDNPGRAKLDVGLAGARLRFDGTMTAPSSTARFAGTLRAEGTDLRGFAAALTALSGSAVPMPGFAAQDFTLEGKAEAGAEVGLKIADLALRLGGSRAIGALDIRLDGQASRVAVKIDRIDLDKWAALERAGTAAPAPGSAASGVYLPRGYAGSLALNADTVTWNAQDLHDVTLAAGLADGALTIERLAAQLPGDGTWTMSGRLTAPQGGVPGFAGAVQAAAPNAGATAAWLGLAGAEAGKGRAVPITAQADVAADGLLLAPASSFRVSKLALTVAGIRAGGEAEYVLGPRPRWRASAVLNELDLDALAGGGGSRAGAPAGLLGPLLGGKAGDGALRLAIGVLKAQGVAARGLFLDAVATAEGVTVNEARADALWGAAVRASGVVRGGIDKPSFAGQVALRAEDAAALFAAFGASQVRRPGRASLSAELRAGFDALNVTHASIEALGSALELSGRVERPLDDARRFDLTVAKGTIELDRALALTGTTPASSLGRFDVKGRVAGASDRISLDGELGTPGALLRVKGEVLRPLRPDRAPNLIVKGEEIDAARLAQALPGLLPASFAAAGRIGLDASLSKSAIEASLTMLGGELRIAGDMPPSARSPVKIVASFPEGQNALRAFVPGLAPPAPIGRLALQGAVQAVAGGFALQGFSVDSAPLGLTGDVTLSTDGPRPKLTGRVEATRPLALDALMPPTARAAAAAPGRGLWPTDPIDLSILQRLDADLRLSAPRMVLAAATLEKPSGRIVLAEGTGEFTEVAFAALGTQVTAHMKVDARAAPAFSGTFKVEHFPLRDFLVGLKMESSKIDCSAIPGRQCTIGITGGMVDGTGNFAMQGKNWQELLSRLNGAFAFKARDLVIDGLDFRELGRRIKQKAVTDFLAPQLALTAMFTGRTAARDIDGEIVAANGSVTLGRREGGQFSGGGVQFLVDGARMLVPGNINLASGAYIFEPRIDLADPNDAPQFGLEVKGRLLDPRGAATEINTGRMEQYIQGRR